jgi:sortase A
MLAAAYEYNRNLKMRANCYNFTNEERAKYNDMLDFSGNGIMGYIEIAAIGVRLPIYHGTDESILQIGAGHLEWTSLPVGGLGSHSAITAHTGLPSSELFTKLDKLKIGDTFVLRILKEELTYTVDQILVVEPNEIGALFIEEGADYCTLITCTPYGINSHRLLVRGFRIPNTDTKYVSDGFTAGSLVSFLILIALLYFAYQYLRKK